MNEQEKALVKAWSDHSRMYKNDNWVYPVISRRAGGISLGINLNPDHVCTFSCAYCQSGQQTGYPHKPIDIDAIERELCEFLDSYANKEFANEIFKDIAQKDKMLKDICISGDGESTAIKEFADVCMRLPNIQEYYKQSIGNFKLRLITNASCLHKQNVQQGIGYLLKNDGEIWAKLDAGSENWFKKINRAHINFSHILKNLESTIANYPICIQTMLCNVQGDVPDSTEISKYIDNLKIIYNVRPQNLLEVQLYTVIRHTALPEVTPLSTDFLNSVKQKIENALPIKVRVF